jgi:ATP-dependent Clp protease adapter protein ClpS
MIWTRRYLQLFFSIVMMGWRMDGVSALVLPLQLPVSMTVTTTTRQQLQQQPSSFHVPATTTHHDRCGGRRQPVRVVLSLLASADGPAILDRPTIVTTTTTTVIEKKREQLNERYVEDSRRRDHETWEVRLYNDGLNTREHVSRSLVQVTGLSEYQAYQTMMRAHQNGMAVVGRYLYEIAEMFHDALKREGIICDIVPVGDGGD